MNANEIIRRFQREEVTRKEVIQVDQLHLKYLGFARELSELCPNNRELALCFTRLEESLHWAKEAILRGEFDYTQPVSNP